jgi:hypothetical protein
MWWGEDGLTNMDPMSYFIFGLLGTIPLAIGVGWASHGTGHGWRTIRVSLAYSALAVAGFSVFLWLINCAPRGLAGIALCLLLNILNLSAFTLGTMTVLEGQSCSRSEQ